MLIVLIREEGGEYMVEKGAETVIVHLDVRPVMYMYLRRKNICNINVNSIIVNLVLVLLAAHVDIRAGYRERVTSACFPCS